VNEETILKEAMQRVEASADPRLTWWRDAKFGMFIHWGLYAIPAGIWNDRKFAGTDEHIMKRARIPVADYEKLAEKFNPIAFDADAWVRLAKAAGQRYIVITAKHHDGFCMYHSQLTPYNIIDATPFNRDPINELADACERYGLKLGFYYSHTRDWHHPDGASYEWEPVDPEQDFDAYIKTYVKGQVHELLTRYGPIALIWFDTPGRISPAQSLSLVDLVHDLQPDCLVNGRVGNARGDYASAGDNTIPPAVVDADFETPATINDTWGFKSYDHNWKSIGDMIHKLVDCVSKGGNYLLNVGPMAEGMIPKASVGRLQGIGAWLDINGESVYGTRRGPLQGLKGYRTTMKSGKLYLHVFDWPAGGRIEVPDPGVDPTRTYLLGDPLREEVPARMEGSSLVIEGPETALDPIDTVIILDS
jgi:alpha-L-fucosidase